MYALTLAFLALCASLAVAAPKPNILFFMVDDLGFYDIGYHNPTIKTPVTDEMAKNGAILERHYTYRYCSPSRTALLSGRLPAHQNQWNRANDNIGGGPHTNTTLLPRMLAKANYDSYHSGKWHLGAASPDLVPTGRGFKGSFGYLSGAEDHYTNSDDPVPRCGFKEKSVDLYHDYTPAFNMNGTYGDFMFTKHTIDMIHAHDKSKPLFIYHANQVNHAPLEAPQRFLDLYPDVNNTVRKTYQAMTGVWDEALKNITDALKETGLWDNTLIVFSSDNGGPSLSDAASANNYPLRGGKYSDLEGGVRVNAWIGGPFLPEKMRGKTLHGFIHMADWYATFAHLAGVDPTDEPAKRAGLPPIDSLNMWPYLSGDVDVSPRQEIILSVVNNRTYGGEEGTAGGFLRADGWKVIFGKQHPALNPGTTYPNGTAPGPAQQECGQNGCLYNVLDDPTEHHELSQSHPQLLKELTDRFNELANTAYQTPFANGDCAQISKVLDTGYWAPFTNDHPYPIVH